MSASAPNKLDNHHKVHGVGHKLRVAYKLVRRVFVQDLARIGIPYVYYRCLQTLFDQDGITQAELSLRSGIEQSGATEVLDRMVAEGLVERIQHRSDRRKRLVFLTPRGRRLRRPLFAEHKRLHRAFLTGISAAEYRSFCAILDRIAANAERLESGMISNKALASVSSPSVKRYSNNARDVTPLPIRTLQGLKFPK